MRCPPFHPAVLARQLHIDAALRWAVFAAVIACIFFLNRADQSGTILSTLLLITVLIAFAAINITSARVAQQTPRITELLESDPPAAEDLLAHALRQRPLQKHVRLALYHRLAALRHQQKRFDESTAICHALLAQRHFDHEAAALPTRPTATIATNPAKPLPNPDRARSHLLLILADARLTRRDLPAAYAAITQLYRQRLNLAELLQLLLLQTRYELAAGHTAHALQNLRKKLTLAELMPAPPCAAMHALLARAAQAQDQPDQAAWLHRRATLLSGPHRYQA